MISKCARDVDPLNHCCVHCLLARLAEALANARAVREGGNDAAGVFCATCRGATRRPSPSGDDSGLSFSYAALIAPLCASGVCVKSIHARGQLPPFGRYPALCDVVTLTFALQESLNMWFAGCDYREEY